MYGQKEQGQGQWKREEGRAMALSEDFRYFMQVVKNDLMTHEEWMQEHILTLHSRS